MRFVAAALAVVLAAGPVSAQSLAEAAKREKERRAKAEKAKAQPTKSYSEADLRAPKGATTAPPAAEMGGTATYEPPAGAGSEGEAVSGGDEASWRERAETQRKAVSDAEGQIRSFEADLERVRVDREPPTANVMDPQREQKRTAEIFRLQDEIKKARAALEKAQQELAAFQEEARRAGIPPGWIR